MIAASLWGGNMSKTKIVITDCDVEKMQKIEDLLAKHPEFEVTLVDEKSADKLMKRITDIFITIGIPAHLKGYMYLREAIRVVIENRKIINFMTKKLYPEVASRFESSPAKVERAIRHALEAGWCRGKLKKLNIIFGLSVYDEHDKPTNGEFIALIADKLIIDGID